MDRKELKIYILGLLDRYSKEKKEVFAAISAMQKLFTGGHLTANLRMKKLKYEQLFEEYKQADLTALQEINDAMCLIKYDTFCAVLQILERK